MRDICHSVVIVSAISFLLKSPWGFSQITALQIVYIFPPIPSVVGLLASPYRGSPGINTDCCHCFTASSTSINITIDQVPSHSNNPHTLYDPPRWWLWVVAVVSLSRYRQQPQQHYHYYGILPICNHGDSMLAAPSSH